MNSNTLSIINTIIATAVSSGNLEMLTADTNSLINSDDDCGMYGISHTFYIENDKKYTVEINITPEEECWIYATADISRGEIKTVKQLKSLLYPSIPCHSSKKEEVVKYFKNI